MGTMRRDYNPPPRTLDGAIFIIRSPSFSFGFVQIRVIRVKPRSGFFSVRNPVHPVNPVKKSPRALWTSLRLTHSPFVSFPSSNAFCALCLSPLPLLTHVSICPTEIDTGLTLSILRQLPPAEYVPIAPL